MLGWQVVNCDVEHLHDETMEQVILRATLAFLDQSSDIWPCFKLIDPKTNHFGF